MVGVGAQQRATSWWVGDTQGRLVSRPVGARCPLGKMGLTGQAACSWYQKQVHVRPLQTHGVFGLFFIRTFAVQ